MRWFTFGAIGAAAALGLGGFSLATGCTVTTTQTDFPDDGGFTLGDARSDAHSSSADGSGGGGGGGGGGGSGSCADFCAKAASASCPSQSSCESDCETQTSKVPASCSDAWDAVLQCGATTGSFNSCDSQGKPKLSGCDTETTTFVSCLTGGGGGKTDAGGGGGSCGSLQTGNAACDTCMKNSCCTQTGACSNNTACVAILQCFTDDNCSADACYTNCENQHTSGVTAEQNMYQCMQDSCSTACQ